MDTDEPYAPPVRNARPQALRPLGVRLAFAVGWVLTTVAAALFLLLAALAVTGILHDERHGGGYAVAGALMFTVIGVLPLAGIGCWLLTRYWPRT